MSGPVTFKQIAIGGIDKEALNRQLIDSGTHFNKYAHILFAHSSFSPSKQTEKVTLVKAKLSDFQLTQTLHNPPSGQVA